MTNTPSLPHHRLHVFGFAREMLVAVRDAHIRDAKLRDEALRSAKGMCLNIAEGAGRVSAADQRRHYQIALGSANEVAACAEIAELHGVAAPVIAEMLERLGHVVRMLLAMCRPR